MNGLRKRLVAVLCVLAGTFFNSAAQTEIYPQHFALDEVELLDGPLRTSMITNAELLMRYDVDKLMTPFIREAKLSKTTDKESKYYGWETMHPSFRNWGDPSWTLEGHVGGHYVSALALAYAGLKSDATQQALVSSLKERLDYCIAIMKDCQDAYIGDTEGMEGFIGGQPITQIWKGLYKNDLTAFRNYGGMVPFYCQHKVLAGVRDAYLYTGSKVAKELFRGLCDWSVNVVSKLSDSDMQSVLGWEHGGMNEPLADAYVIFGDKKYLDGAKKFSQTEMLNGMQTLNTTFLNNRHANTQVPKYIGFQRISQVDAASTKYKTAARNFWTDVATNRTVCIGGNSVDEHFLNQGNGDRYISSLNGPESCNTNNMLKLTENLFDDTHAAKYVDFYENAMYNHILSTQDPETGGYVYFTTLRPQGYKIYSQVNQGMWCCVGTGMENHSKYGHFVYTHDDSENTLYVNLFTASKLSNSKYSLTQETRFPYEGKSAITIGSDGEYIVAVRHPSWAGKEYAISINGEQQIFDVKEGSASFVKINRKWKKGDKIEIDLPMQLRSEACPLLGEYVAFKYGPILLGAKTNTADLKNEYAGEGRMDHAPGNMASTMSIINSPLLICEHEDLMKRIDKTGDLAFKIDVHRDDTESSWRELTLEPFFGLHHSRYMIYWYHQNAEEFAKSSLAQEEAKKQALIARTLDYVGTGEQQSEVGHQAKYSSDSNYGSYNGEIYRDTQSGGYVQYVLANEKGDTDLSVMCRFTTADNGRVCTIYIDGKKLQAYTIPSSYSPSENGFFNHEIPIPESILRDAEGNVKKQFTFKIVASGSTPLPGLYYLRLMKDYNSTYATNYKFDAKDWSNTGDASRVSQSRISVSETDNTITVKASGSNNVCLSMSKQKYQINVADKYFIIKASGVSATDGASYLWWFNGVNHASSVKPTKVQKNADGDIELYWDITTSGLDDKSKGGLAYDFSQGETIFGLTSTSGTAVIKYIGFNSTMTIPSGGDPTSIASNNAMTSTNKGIYNLAGQRLDVPQKGINIINGNKVLVM